MGRHKTTTANRAEAVRLFTVDNLTVSEIARKLECSRQNIDQQLKSELGHDFVANHTRAMWDRHASEVTAEEKQHKDRIWSQVLNCAACKRDFKRWHKCQTNVKNATCSPRCAALWRAARFRIDSEQSAMHKDCVAHYAIEHPQAVRASMLRYAHKRLGTGVKIPIKSPKHSRVMYKAWKTRGPIYRKDSLTTKAVAEIMALRKEVAQDENPSQGDIR